MTATLSPNLMRYAQSAYNSAAVRLADSEAASAAANILGQFPDLPTAKAAIEQDVAPAR